MFVEKLFLPTKRRTAFLLPLTLLLAAILTLAISPAARAAVQSLLSFNGVEVTIDPETGSLQAEGNTDAIVYQDENNIFIEGENGIAAGVGLAAIDTEMIPLAEVQTVLPAFELPTNLPAGYTVMPEAERLGEAVIVHWQNEAGDTISYIWGTLPAPPVPAFLGEDAVVIDSVSPEQAAQLVEEHQLPLGPDGGEIAFLATTSSAGVPVQITATDSSLSVETLQAMVP